MKPSTTAQLFASVLFLVSSVRAVCSEESVCSDSHYSRDLLATAMAEGTVGVSVNLEINAQLRSTEKMQQSRTVGRVNISAGLLASDQPQLTDRLMSLWTSLEAALDIIVVIETDSKCILEREMMLSLLYSTSDSSRRRVEVFFEDICGPRIQSLNQAAKQTHPNPATEQTILSEEKQAHIVAVVQSAAEQYLKKTAGLNEHSGLHQLRFSNYACMGGTFDYIHYGHKVELK